MASASSLAQWGGGAGSSTSGAGEIVEMDPQLAAVLGPGFRDGDTV
jgi:hypothetical protein